MFDFRTPLLGALLLGSVAAPAMAADLYEPPVVETPAPVEYREVSTGGWYIRGDVGYNFTKFRGATYSVVSPGVDCCGIPNGNASLVDGIPLKGGLRDAFSFGGGVGYKINSYLRTDVTLDYLAKAKFSGTTNGFQGGVTTFSTDRSSMTALSLLANAYVDIGTWNRITPYVGAGIGGAHVKWGSLENTACAVGGGCDPTLTHGGHSEWRFAYAAMAGASYAFTDNLALDLGYKYTRISGGRMFGGDNAVGGPYTGNGRDKGIDLHTIKAGLRYTFGASSPEPAPAFYEPAPVYK